MPEQNNPSLKTVVVPLCANATASCRQIGQAKMVGETILVVLAEVTGWGYFFCWTACMFPQMHENWRRKSVVGFSFDMLGYFLISYITYLIYNVTVFFKPELIFEKSGEDNPVKLTDVVFAIVAFACTVFQVIQCFIYDRGSQTIHFSTVLTCVGSLVALAALVILKFFHVSSWFLVLQYCGYVKFVISFGTYFPQVWLNYKRKSTIGFHIAGVLLDVGGGVLSILQMFIYCWIEHSIVQVTGNIPKLALGVVTLLFGLVLTWQHYVSYAGNESGISYDYLEEAPLLRSSVIKMSYPSDMTNETRTGLVKSAIVPLDNYNSERARVKNFFASL